MALIQIIHIHLSSNILMISRTGFIYIEYIILLLYMVYIDQYICLYIYIYIYHIIYIYIRYMYVVCSHRYLSHNTIYLLEIINKLMHHIGHDINGNPSGDVLSKSCDFLLYSHPHVLTMFM